MGYVFLKYYIKYYILFNYHQKTISPNIDFKTQYQKIAEAFVKATQASRYRHGIFIPAVISQIPQNAESCADLGCGNAYYHNIILQRKPNIQNLIGIDFCPTMFQMIPPQIKSNPKTHYLLQDLTEPLIMKEQYFDCLVSIFTIEYVTRQKIQKYLKNCQKILKPNGKLIILSSHINNYKNDPLIRNVVPYQIITDKQIIQDGGQSQIHILQSDFRVTFLHWQNQTLVNYLKMAGFQGKVDFLREQHIDKTLFNEKEIRTIVDSKGWRLVIGTKKNQ